MGPPHSIMVRVSVVIPTYNRTHLLERAIRSVIHQNFNDYEIIVVDDGSDANTKGVLSKFENKIELISHDVNKGGAAARNTGINQAKGEYIAFLDDDDIWKKNKLAKQVTRLTNLNNEYGVIYTGIRRQDSEGRTILLKNSTIRGSVNKQLYLNNFVGSYSCVMVHSEVIENAGLLDPRFDRWQDWEWYVRLAQHSKFAVLPEPLVIQEKQGKSHYQSLNKSLELFKQKYRNDWKKYGTLFDRKVMSNLFYKVGCSGIRSGKRRAPREQLLKSIYFNPFKYQAYTFLILSFLGVKSVDKLQKAKRELYNFVYK